MKRTRAEEKAVQMESVKSKLDELKDRKMTPKKANLVKHLKNLKKWNERKSHAVKRGKTQKIVVPIEVLESEVE
ncbi:MAG: hypothetical protein HOH07_03845 [Euryarchaeota archaeon]|nr:hypothetical protein [Euryarchaeota archaeon]